MSVHSIKTVYRAAALLLAAMMFCGQSLARNGDELNQVLERAHGGDAIAQYELAERYYDGDEVRRDYDEAFEWYLKAANQNHAEAQHRVAYFYQHGLGNTDKDEEEAFAWFHRAAMLGHTPSQTQVALMYSLGIGVEQDKAMSSKWSNRVLEKKGLLEPAAEQATQPAKATKTTKTTKTTKARQAVSAPAAAPRQAATKPAAAATAKGKAGMSPEQYKAWRREQARKLVEEANRRAAMEGDWTE